MARELVEGGPRSARGEDILLDLHLTWDEAQQGCTRLVEVDGGQLWIDVPPGVQDEQVLCFAGRGSPGIDGGAPGDLLLRLDVAPEPVRGEDVALKHEISAEEARDGARKTVKVNGRNLWLRIPAGATAGQVIRIQGEGGNGQHGGARGDLLVVLEISGSLPVPVVEGKTPADTALTPAAPSEPLRLTRKKSPAAVLVPVLAVAAAIAGAVLVLPRLAPPSPSPGAAVAPTPPVAGTREVCVETGALPTRYCPKTESRSFAAGQEPTRACEKHLPLLVSVCASSGKLVGPACPQTAKKSFAPGAAPSERCTLHKSAPTVQVRLCAASGLRVSAACPAAQVVLKTVTRGAEPQGFCRVHRPAAPVRATPPRREPTRAEAAPKPAPRRRFCGGCGRALSGSSSFCGRCGRKL